MKLAAPKARARGSMMTSGRALSVGLLLSACGGAPALPAGWTEVESAQFQQVHDQQIGSAHGPLSTVASHYVAPGQTLALGIDDGAVSTTAPAGEPRVVVEVAEPTARCLEGCGPTPMEVSPGQLTALGRFSLSMSPQSGSLRILVHDPEAVAAAGYDGVPWFPMRPDLIVAGRFEADTARPSVELSTSRGLSKSFVRAGTITARVGDQTVSLVGYQSGPDGSPLLVPFTDATTGDTTYPVGRYLEVQVEPNGVAVLDFNRATNPWCVYSEHYNCPVPPADNGLAMAIEAGERAPVSH